MRNPFSESIRVWLYAVGLLFCIQIGMVGGAVLSQDAVISMTLCDLAGEHGDDTERLFPHVGYQISVEPISLPNCDGMAYAIDAQVKGPVWKFSTAHEEIATQLKSEGLVPRSYSVNFSPDVVYVAFLGFLLSAGVSALFLRHQKTLGRFIRTNRERPARKSILATSALSFILLILALWVPMQLLADRILPDYLFLQGEQITFGILGWVFLATLAPFTEEVIFRAWLLEAWDKIWGWRIALPVSAVCFSLAHPMGLIANLIFLVPGIVLGALWLKTRSLSACVATHSAYNTFVLCSLILWR